MRAVLILALLPLPALAQEGLFTPPDGCRLEMTVQLASCRVAQYYRCEGDTPGDQWVAYFRQDGGPVFVSRIDRETRWMESTNTGSGIVDVLDEEVDAASFSTLLRTGRDDYDFYTLSNDGWRLRHTGVDELTGRSVTIDGVTLQETRFSATATLEDGTFVYSREGNQYISEAHGRFYGGPEVMTDWEGTVERLDESPREFSRPGAPGFGSITPRFGCAMQMVGL